MSNLQSSLNDVQNALNNPSISKIQNNIIGDLYNLQNNLNIIQNKISSPSITKNTTNTTNTTTSTTKVVSSKPTQAETQINYTNPIIFLIILSLLTYLFFSYQHN